MQKTNTSFAIIHSLDGYDELSLTGDARVITNEGDRVLTPEQLGKRMVSPSDIYGGNNPEEAAKIFINILKGKGSWAQNAVVLANAAMALHCTGNFSDYDLAYAAAVESLESGSALASLETLISMQS
jgi:anthranilate phosphoribosyltransferase